MPQDDPGRTAAISTQFERAKRMLRAFAPDAYAIRFLRCWYCGGQAVTYRIPSDKVDDPCGNLAHYCCFKCGRMVRTVRKVR